MDLQRLKKLAEAVHEENRLFESASTKVELLQERLHRADVEKNIARRRRQDARDAFVDFVDGEAAP